MCVCTGNASLISHKIKSSILHLSCLLMGTKGSSKLRVLVFGLYISLCSAVRSERCETLIYGVPTICQAFARCFTQMITSFKQLYETGVLIPILIPIRNPLLERLK